MLQNLSAVEATDALPPEAAVVVIGGGIVGVSAALCLAEAGVAVVVLEKGVIAGEQSSRNWGWVRKMGRHAHDVALAIRSEKIWAGLETRIGESVGYRVRGSLYPCDDGAALALQRKWKAEVADPHKLDSELLDAAEVRRLLPGLARPFVGALHTPSDGCAEPALAAPAIARAARRAGARVLPGCAALEIDLRDGKVRGVRTEQGFIACRDVVVAGGAWSRNLLAPLGVALPQLRLLASVARTSPVPDAAPLCVGASNFAFRPRADGGFVISRRTLNQTYLSPDHFRFFREFLPLLCAQRKVVQLRANASFFDEWSQSLALRTRGVSPYQSVRTLDPPAHDKTVQSGLNHLSSAYPVFAKAEIRERWAGFIDGSPDSLPIISPVGRISGLMVASGFSGHGFGTGPAAGEMVAEMLLRTKPTCDPTPYRLERLHS